MGPLSEIEKWVPRLRKKLTIDKVNKRSWLISRATNTKALDDNPKFKGDRHEHNKNNFSY